MPYETVIGLEAHVQLATDSKAFCDDPNAFGAEPNRHISVISLGYPGTLPKLNEKQVNFAVLLGLALGATVNLESSFDRKNYFYADLPKGYQITQDVRPICVGGRLPIRVQGRTQYVRIHHVHMEEDAGKSIHSVRTPGSLVDFNRAGTPLLEIVTEPDLRSGEEVDAFMTTLRQLVRWLGICDGNMEEGSLRCDVNVSVRPVGSESYGTRCEIKNMNSMRYARRAIAYERERQIAIVQAGGSVEQETRQFDPAADHTTALREKENAHDYRYFPEPDLPPVLLAESYVDQVRSALGTLPWQALEHLLGLGLEEADARLIAEDRRGYAAFVEYAKAFPDVTDLAKLWVNGVLPHLPPGARPALPPGEFVIVQELIDQRAISAANAVSRLLPDLLARPGQARERAADLGLLQTSDADYLATTAREVITEHAAKVAAYRKGKKGLIGFFMGEVMRRTEGSAEPQATRQLLQSLLENDP